MASTSAGKNALKGNQAGFRDGYRMNMDVAPKGGRPVHAADAQRKLKPKAAAAAAVLADADLAATRHSCGEVPETRIDTVSPQARMEKAPQVADLRGFSFGGWYRD